MKTHVAVDMDKKDLAAARLISLDQFRGYTVLGMFFVNFVGHFRAIPDIFKHHNTYCSYADTIMPQFFFAVGFAYRMTFLRRVLRDGPRAAVSKMIQRCLGLILIGAVIYHLDGGAKTWSDLQALGVWGFLKTAFQRNVFQALVHIGVTSLWVMPLMAARAWVLVAFACGSAMLHVALSHWFYYEWVMKRPGIDGGPLGFLTWTVPLLVGALAYDLMQNTERRIVHDAATESGNCSNGQRPSLSSWQRLLAWGLLLMLLGYALSCVNLFTPPGNMPIGPQPSTISPERSALFIEPPFMPPSRPINMWTMSQRAGSVSYLAFGAGFSLALFALFVMACDTRSWRVGMLTTLGSNALAGYIIHDLVIEAMRPYTPKDSAMWYALASFGLFLGITYLFIRYLERNRIYLRL